MPLLDIHAHILPHVFLDMVNSGKIDGVSLVHRANGTIAVDFPAGTHPCSPVFYDEHAQLALMDEHGIDLQAVSVSPRLFFYEMPAETASTLCRLFNDEILQRCRLHSSRFLPIGGLPMQDPHASVAEIRRLAQNGVHMVQVGTSVAGLPLDDARFLPVFEAAEEMGMAIMLHPLITGGGPLARAHHLSNVADNPYQTMLAASSLIAGGVFNRFGGLQVMLVHGGGYLPYQAGRLDHAFHVRPAGEFSCRREPSSYIRSNLWFDALVFRPEALNLLLSMAGEDRICYGTDAPYDMADYAQLERFTSRLARDKAAFENAKSLLGL